MAITIFTGWRSSSPPEGWTSPAVPDRRRRDGRLRTGRYRMARRQDADTEITPELRLRAYAGGIFPMAESADDPALYWVEPRERGVIPLDGFHVPSRLARTVRNDRFEIRIDTDFDGVIAGCAS